MKFFVDSADIDEIERLADMGLVDGVTTNPAIIAKTGKKIHQVLEDLCDIVSGPVSAQVISQDMDGMLREAGNLSKIAPNITIKVPLTEAGLRACTRLRERDVMVNVTLCFSTTQALLAAKAGATFVSPFVGRLDDYGHDGMKVIEQIITCFRNDPQIATEVLVSSVRNPNTMVKAAELGAHVATAAPEIYYKMIEHPLSEKGLAQFLKAWETAGQSI